MPAHAQHTHWRAVVMAGPIIYNLFPTLAGPLDGWAAHAVRARLMGFDWLYVNPVHYPGFSGSLYAPKMHGRLHPTLGPPGAEAVSLDALRPVIETVRDLGLSMMVDLVINHTARDCPLVSERPAWFRRDEQGRLVSPTAMDPANSEDVTVWGDLAEVDNEGSADREALWRYWEELVVRFVRLGVTGFRCDAAYKVPAALWRRLRQAARAEDSTVVFVGETLGCRIEEVETLADAGLDYFYNSSKWWDFDEPWCLEQHERFGRIAPSISFPESHDTERLAAETGGSEAIQRQRYVFAAVFSAGVQITVGYEFGFRRRLDVVKTSPRDWEDPAFDLSPFIARVNGLKQRHPLLAGEGRLERIMTDEPDVTVLRRRSDATGHHRGLVLINRNAGETRDVTVRGQELTGPAGLVRPCLDGWRGQGQPVPPRVRLAPAEVALVMEPC
jgi:starch synthase (maltosyl-transferring)